MPDPGTRDSEERSEEPRNGSPPNHSGIDHPHGAVYCSHAVLQLLSNHLFVLLAALSSEPKEVQSSQHELSNQDAPIIHAWW